MSLRHLAQRLGVSPSLISQIETGRARPSVSTLYAIAAELGVSLDELLFLEPERAAPAADPRLAERGMNLVGATERLGPVQRADSRILIAERAGELLGCAHIAIEDGAGYFGMFSVSPTLQGGGVGKALLAEAERVVRDEWRLPAMRMTVIDVRDELIAFYERRGYARTGIKKPFPYGDERFGQPKRDDLRFEVLEKAL